MIARGLGLACALLLLSASSAYAQDYARNGFYVGLAGSVGIDTASEDELEDITGVNVNVDEALGLHARLGYRFHPRISGEIHFEWLDDADISILGIDALTLERWTLTANAKAYLLTGRFQPFLFAGAGLMQAEVEDTLGLFFSVTNEDFAARFGGGIDIYASEKFVVSLDTSYVLPTGDLEDLDYVSIAWGFQYRF